VLVGTAGHIDHGKTALVRALTGIDTDRLPEEKSRGITIELGFAHRATAAGDTLAVIDVPGHERFVRTMIAGATGIDVVMLVIAADEGVMPQTREHLDICGLLGIPRGLIALTKADLVDADWLGLVSDEVRAAVKGTFLERAPLIPCSAVTGAGLADVAAALERLAAETGPRAVDGPMRLPLDRVFTMKGFGTVATGTLASGRLREGDPVVGLPDGAGGASASGRSVGVTRGIEVHGEPRAEALAGERTAANVHGLERDELARGMVLVHRGEMQASSVVDVELAILPLCPAPVKSRAKILFHALTTQESGTLLWHDGASVEPGGRALAQLHLQRPVALLPGDRFILRGFRTLPGYGTTIGGGRVVRVLSPKRRRGAAGADAARARLRAMAAASAPDERIALEIEAAGAAGIDRAALRARVGEGIKTIDRALEILLSRRAAVTFNRDTGAVVSAQALGTLGAAVTVELERFHAAHPLRPGVAREELRTSAALTRTLDPRLFAVVVAELAKRGAIDLVGADQVRRAGFSPRQAEAEKDLLVSKLIAIYREGGLAPPWSGELAARLGVAPADAAAALEILIRRGDLVRVKPDLCFDRASITTLGERLRRYLDGAGQITPQQWKELTGQTRKFAIPLAEHFDAERLTLRIGDIRKLRTGA
jgi:selenocysteine-specific elongation factor